jgi:2-polyprenyl-6-methoxyphenol hydroxylase-like FAD-dependent oxidoreductase
MAGLLTAGVLSQFYGSVTVVERDRLPERPDHRKGVPQGRHVHQFLTRGTHALAELFPGILDELVAAGAVINDPSRIYARMGHYELTCTGRPADPEALTYYQASRPLVEFGVRRRVTALHNVTFLDGHEAAEPVSTADTVTGVRIINRDNGIATVLDADLVVDAMGRATRTPAFLDDHGFGWPPEEQTTASWAYSSHLMHIPDGRIAERMAMVDPGNSTTRLLLLAYENNTWMLAIGHAVGHKDPPADFAELLTTAEGLIPAPIMAGLRDATPIGDIAIFRNTAAVWRRYDRMAHFPAGALVIGDALCNLNPLHGQGMTMAAVQALTLRDCLRDGDTDLRHRFFSAAAGHIGATWAMNAVNDRAPSAAGAAGPLRRRINRWMTNAALRAAAGDITVKERLFRVANLVDPPARLQDPALLPRILFANLRHRRRICDDDQMADRCAECGFTYDLAQAETVGVDIRRHVAEIVAILHDVGLNLRSRRQPGVWSPLEYGCHLRDMLLVQRERVLAARRVDRPDCTSMGRDERVDHDGYATQEPDDVARQLTDAAKLFSNVLARLGADWDRTVLYHYPQTQQRSLRWVAVHTLHEAHHHLLDIRAQV